MQRLQIMAQIMAVSECRFWIAELDRRCRLHPNDREPIACPSLIYLVIKATPVPDAAIR